MPNTTCSLASGVSFISREDWTSSRLRYPVRSFGSYLVGIEWSFLTLGSGLLIRTERRPQPAGGSGRLPGHRPYNVVVQEGIARDIALSNFTPETRERLPLIDKKWDELTDDDKAFITSRGGRTAVAYMKENYYPVLLLWFMWPATALMITSAITAVLLKWRSIVESFRYLRAGAAEGNREDVSLRSVLVSSVLLTVGLAVVQRENFGMSYLQTALAVAFSLPLILVGVRVLGETNNGPISVMMNGLQAVFAVFFPGHTGHNLIAAGIQLTFIQPGTFRTTRPARSSARRRASDLGSARRVPIGARPSPSCIADESLSSSAERRLPAPTGIKIAGMAALISQGIEAFPHGGSALDSHRRRHPRSDGPALPPHRCPSAAGFGFGLILPGINIDGHRHPGLAVVASTSHRPLRQPPSPRNSSPATASAVIIPAVSWFFGD